MEYQSSSDASSLSQHPVPIPVTPQSNDKDLFLLPSLQYLFPYVQSYSIVRTIEQSNAVGYIVQLFHRHPSDAVNRKQPSNEEERAFPDRVFVKHVDAVRYVRTKRNWNDLHRTLLYARTEARFYQKFAPVLLQSTRGIMDARMIPRHYCAEFTASDWIPDHETATSTLSSDKSIHDLPGKDQPRGGLIVLECVDDKEYFQDSPISIEHAKQCLTAVATLHVAAWENQNLIQLAEETLNKSSFHLKTRNPTELANIEDAWNHFLNEFRISLEEHGLWKASVLALGKRIAATATYISDQLTPQSVSDPYVTLVHGDFKSMNAFLSKDGTKPAVMVDYASTGTGIGMSDVAMHIHHAVLPEHLAGGGEEELLRHYWNTVNERLASVGKVYPWEVAESHYHLAVADYFRFFLGRFWNTTTVASMEKNADSKNTCLLNRHVDAAMAFVRRVDAYLIEIEKEFSTQE